MVDDPASRSCLTQDVAFIPMLVIIPLLVVSDQSQPGQEETASQAIGKGTGPTLAIIESLPAWGVAGVMLASIAVIILGGRFLCRPLFRYIASSGLMEISTAATLLLVVGTALLMTAGSGPVAGTRDLPCRGRSRQLGIPARIEVKH